MLVADLPVDGMPQDMTTYMSGARRVATSKKKKNPCWSGYEAVGMKKKGGKTVPNCVPKKGKGKKK